MTEIINKNLIVRILSALAMIPPVLGLTYVGGLYFDAMIVVAVAAMAWEWSRMVSGGRFGHQGWLLTVGLLAGVAAASMGFYIHAILLLAFVGVLLFGISEARRLTGGAPFHSTDRATAVDAKNALWMSAGAFYIGVPSIALIWIRADWDNGLLAVVWLLVLVWAADSGAYAAGRLIGGPKMAPKISPNKTWAGLAGCVVAASLAGAGLTYAAGFDVPIITQVAIVSAVVGLVSQGGDLVESAVKRHFNVKDSSQLIPGHGGVLDRVDALLAAIAAAALISLSNKITLMS